MAEYDDREDDYGDDGNYDDPSDYQDYDWNRYDDENLDDIINDYDDKLSELEDEYSKKKKDNTRAAVQSEIDKYKNRKRFLENLKRYRRDWKPSPTQQSVIKTQIGILEKDLKNLNSSLRRCSKEESRVIRRKQIALVQKTLEYYKKSFSLIKGGSSSTPLKSSFFFQKPIERKSTKPEPPKLPNEKEWSALGEAGGLLKSALGYGWWGTKGLVKGTAGVVKEITDASITVGNVAIEGGKLASEGGSSLYSTFRENIVSQEKVSKQHNQIDRETEQKNERVVKKLVPPSSENFYRDSPSEELKTQVINLAIEKNNLEGEKRKEEITRQENEKLCQQEEERRNQENKRREEENKRREEENKRREEENKRREEIVNKLKNLGKGLSENEQIRLEEEDLRQEQENTRQLNENERQMKEDTRQTFENLRQEDEKIRQELDNNRKIYWEVMLEEKEKWLEKMTNNNELFKKLLNAVDADEQRRQRLDKSLNDNEDKRLGNETIRLENEQDRRNAEEKRIENEKQRVKNEKARVDAELKRVTGETRREEQEQNRIDEEEKRFVNEEERLVNEKARIAREKIAIASEKQRIDNEKRRENFYKSKLEAEKERVEAEKGRKEREQIFQENEKQRIQNEKIRISNDERRKFIQEQNLKLLEERANKLDNIEMSFSKKQRIEEKQPKKTFETYFTNKENSTEWIEDEKLKKKVENILENIDKEEENNPQTYSNALLDGIQEMEYINLTAEWEKKIQIEEKDKLKWRQKINALNEALLEKNIILTDNDPNIKDFYDKHLKHSETSKNELNGFYFGDIKVIKRTTQKTFIINTSKIANEKVNEFIAELKKLDSTAETVISNEVGVFADSETNKEFAESYIRELREEQKDMIRNGTLENGEFFEMEEFNEINREIEDIRKNKKFKIRPKVWARSFGGFVSRFVKYMKLVFKRHFKLLIGLFLTGIGATSTSIILENFLRKAGYKIGEMEKNLPKKLKEVFSKTLPEFFKKYLGNYYGYYLSAFFSVIAVIFRGIIFGFTKSVVVLSANIIGSMGNLMYIFITSFGFVGFWAGSKVFDTIGYYSYKLYEESFYMSNNLPPDNILERRAEDENMSKDNYKKKFSTPNRFYNSNLAKIASYPISAASYGTGIASDKGKEVLNWMAHWGIVVGILGGIIIIIELLLKMR